MLYVETNSKNACYNFAAEYYLLHERDLGEKIFLFWRTVPTLMVGKYQNITSEINLKYAKEHNIAIVRRQSGGGTIYTDEGSWQYSYIIPDLRYEDINFKENSSAVVSTLNKLDVHANFNERNDILIDNKKISGTARYVTKKGIIHHGSLLYNTDIDEMVRSITVDDEKIVSKGIKSIYQRVANIVEYMPHKISAEEFKHIMVDSIMGENYKRYTLTDCDIKRINEIKESVFENWNWIWGNNPGFEITKSRRLQGGKLEISYNAYHGIIKTIHFAGDFFYDDEILKLEESLYGCPLNYSEILLRLNECQCEKHFFQITNQEIALLILE
jgi:lipoate-protein ligase A